MTTMHHAEATAADWLDLAAEARDLADDPRCSDESREYLDRAAMEYEIAAIAAHIAERTPMRTGKLP
jgi:hypothetical protein